MNVHVMIIMHAASVALLLHGVLLVSLAGLIIRSNFSAQTLLLIGLLLNIHPMLLSYVQIPPDSIQVLSHPMEDACVVPMIGEKLASIQNEDTPKAEDTTINIEHESCFTTASVDNPRSELTSLTDEDTFKITETDRLGTSYSPKHKLIKSVRGRGTFDNDKENEPSPLRPVTARGTTPFISHRSGLRPLTLTTNPSLDIRDSLRPRRTVSLFNGAMRQSPLFYLSDSSREHSLPARSAEIFARRASFPPYTLSCIEQGEIQLTSKLQEEMKLTARLRNDLVELRDRASAELNQSKYEAQALAVAVDAREYFIKDLAASVEFLRVENTLLKKANRRGLCQNGPTEVFTGTNIDENLQPFSPKIKTREQGQEDVNIANIITQQSRGLKSVREKRLGQRCVKRSSIASGCLSGISRDIKEHNSSRDTINWLSLGTVSEPTLKPPHGSGVSIQASPSTFTDNDAAYCEYAMDTPERYFEVEFPTISPQFPPFHAAALAYGKVAISSNCITIYEVDGRALAETHEHLVSPQRSTDPVFSRYSMHQATTRHTAPHLIDNTSLASKQTCHGGASCLAIQQDSPFYAVPASAFIVPRAMCQPSGQCP